MTFTVECAYCGKEFEASQKDFEKGMTGEPTCPDCQKLIDAGREDEIDG